MQRLFASDFDGTLHFWTDGGFGGPDDPGEATSPKNLAAIRAFQAEGGLFGVCTGRPLIGLTSQTGDDIPFDFYIATSGAAVFDRDRQPIWRVDLTREVIREIYDLLLPLSLGSENALVIGADNYWTLADQPRWPQLGTARSIDEIAGPISGMGIETETVEGAQEAAALINERFDGVACAFVNLASIDVVPYGCSKGTGLARAAAHYGATLTGGIGDSFNDLPLLEAADVAYTFPTSEPRVRHAADLLVSDVAEALGDFGRR